MRSRSNCGDPCEMWLCSGAKLTDLDQVQVRTSDSPVAFEDYVLLLRTTRSAPRSFRQRAPLVRKSFHREPTISGGDLCGRYMSNSRD